jgi:hypothetical protein
MIRRERRRLEMGRVLAAVALAAGSWMLAAGAAAQSPAAKPAGVKFVVAEGLQANLARRVGEKVELVLSSGTSLTGTVKEVGTGGVHLAALEGKEYYDALVRIDQISAVVVRAK